MSDASDRRSSRQYWAASDEPTEEEEQIAFQYEREREEQEEIERSNDDFHSQWKVDSDGHFHKGRHYPSRSHDFDDYMGDDSEFVIQEGRQAILEQDLDEAAEQDGIVRQGVDFPTPEEERIAAEYESDDEFFDARSHLDGDDREVEIPAAAASKVAADPVRDLRMSKLGKGKGPAVEDLSAASTGRTGHEAEAARSKKTVTDAIEIERSNIADKQIAKSGADRKRGTSSSSVKKLNEVKRQVAVNTLPGVADCSGPSGKACGANGTYATGKQERKRLEISPRAPVEAEHVVPYGAFYANSEESKEKRRNAARSDPARPGRPDSREVLNRGSCAGKSAEKQLPAYLEVKELHRRHPGTEDKSQNRAESGWPRLWQYQSDVENILKNGRGLPTGNGGEPTFFSEGSRLSIAYQLNQLGYAHVLKEMNWKSDPNLVTQLEQATNSYNHMVTHNPQVKLPDRASDETGFQLDGRGQAEAVLAREAAITGQWPTDKRMLEVSKKFQEIEKSSAAPIRPDPKTPPRSRQGRTFDDTSRARDGRYRIL